MVVSRCDVGGERPECVERGLLAQFFLEPDVLHDLVHGDVPRPSIMTCTPCDFAIVVSSPSVRSSANWASSLASAIEPGSPSPMGEGDVVATQDVAQLDEVRVEEAFLVVRQAPRGHDGPAARHNPGGLGGRLAAHSAAVHRRGRSCSPHPAHTARSRCPGRSPRSTPTGRP